MVRPPFEHDSCICCQELEEKMKAVEEILRNLAKILKKHPAISQLSANNQGMSKEKEVKYHIALYPLTLKLIKLTWKHKGEG
jgi:hypothetical protein